MLRAILVRSRYLVALAVVGALFAALVLFVFGLVEAFVATVDAVRHGGFDAKTAKRLALAFIEIVDLFLLATVMQIIAIGLYELFIDDSLPVPEWLAIRTLDDLKNKLTAVIVVVLGVLFLGQIVAWDGERDVFGFGAAIALVIGALTAFLAISRKPKA
jgi:uncharacterized membrane protein YqhA